MKRFFFILLLAFTNGALAEDAENSLGAEVERWVARCQGWMCDGLVYLAPGSNRRSLTPHLHFELDAEDALAKAFADQVVALVALNLEGLVTVTPKLSRLNALAERDSVDDLFSEVKNLDHLNQENDQTKWVLRGSVRQDDDEVVELQLILESIGNLPDLGPNSLGIELGKKATIRAAISDWRPVGHYLAEAFLTEERAKTDAAFLSQIIFVSNQPGRGNRIGRIDQTGGGLRWVSTSGQAVEGAQFLQNRFELAFLDQGGDEKTLKYHNLLTGRTFPLATLPDLVGSVALGDTGRLIGFASHQETETDLTDLFVVDVQTTALTLIELPSSSERHPSFSPDLTKLAFISQTNDDERVMIARGRDLPDLTWDMNQLITIDELVRSPHKLAHPAWSPTGDRLAYIEHDVDTGISHLRIYNFETKEVSLLASGKDFAHPTWGPGGDLIALVFSRQDDASAKRQILRLDLSQGVGRILLTPFDVMSLDWSSTSRSAPPQ